MLKCIGKNTTSIVVKKVVDLLSDVRRVSHPCHHHEYYDCIISHAKKIHELIEDQKCITFILPAFPAKSPNRYKTFGSLPDMGERLSLYSLNQLCDDIKQFYSPGAKIIICSDGRVFNDLVKVKDSEVNFYSQAIENMLQQDSLTNISLFSLDDYYHTISYEDMRARLVSEFGESVDDIKSHIKIKDAIRQQFNGIHRFIFEDNLSKVTSVSRNKLRNISKEITYLVIQRSNAWSCLLEKQFPAAIRLSIHPQLCGSNKIGIMLLKSEDVWATPWHRVAIHNGREYRLIRQKDAVNLGALPVFVDDHFSHYRLK